MILIIGATGQTGGAIAKELIEGGQGVRALVRNLAKAEGLRQLGVDVRHGDAADPGSLQSALEGVEKLVLATSVEENSPAIQAGILNVVKGTVKQIVRISALGAKPDSPVRLLRMHGIGDADLRKSGMAYTIVQPVFFMQNFLQSAATIQTLDAIVLPTRDGKMGQIDVRDIGALGAKVATEPGHENKEYLISSHDSLSGAEAAEKLSLAIGRKIRFLSPDPKDFKTTLLQSGIPSWSTDGLIELYEFVAQGNANVTTDAFRQVTNREPISFEQFAQDHAQVFLQTATGA